MDARRDVDLIALVDIFRDIFRKVDTMPATAETRRRRARRQFSDEFKEQAVRLVLDEGKSVTAVARELDLVPSALGQCVRRETNASSR